MLAQAPRRVVFSPLRRLGLLFSPLRRLGLLFAPHRSRASSKRRRVVLPLLAVPLLLLFAYWYQPDLFVSTFIQPFLNAFTEWYDFVPNEAERACLAAAAGTAGSGGDGVMSFSDGSSAPPPPAAGRIPHIVHFIWNPGYPPSSPSSMSSLSYTTPPDISFTFALAIRAAHKSLRPDHLKLHYSHALPSANMTTPSTHPNWHAALPFITDLVHHPVESYLAPELFPRLMEREEEDRRKGNVKNRHVWDPAHAADVLRLHVLLEEGGIYLDTDAFALREFPEGLMMPRTALGKLPSREQQQKQQQQQQQQHRQRRRRRQLGGGKGSSSDSSYNETTDNVSWDFDRDVEQEERSPSPPPPPAVQATAVAGNDPGIVVMAHEGGFRYGLGNGVLLASPDAAFLSRWLDEYRATYDGRGPWNYHSVRLPKLLSRRPLSPKPSTGLGSADTGVRNGVNNGVCTLPPESFFWPLWTPRHVRWMHEPLQDGGPEALDVRTRLARFGGALYERQWVYSAWNHAAGKYLTKLTTEKVAFEETRFNILVRRFLIDQDET